MTLPVSDIIDVNITFDAPSATNRNFGALLVVGETLPNKASTPEPGAFLPVRNYSDLPAVVTDYGVQAPEYLAAAAYFGQSPTPNALRIGMKNSEETFVEAISRIRTGTSDWYAVALAPASSEALSSSDILAAADYVEKAVPPSIFVVTVGTADILSSTSESDIASQLSAKAYSRTVVQYSTTSPYAAISLFGLFATVDYSGINTTITAKFKTEPGVSPEDLGSTDAQTLDKKSVNYYALYANGSSYLQQGVMSSGRWIDSQIGSDAFVNALQVAGINCLSRGRKVPQTDAGMTTLKATYDDVCEQYVRNGFLGEELPWRGAPVGSLNTGDTLVAGYFVYCPPLASQSISDRSARKAVVMTVCINESGAVHSGLINVNIEQ